MEVWIFNLIKLAIEEELDFDELTCCCIEQGIKYWYVIEDKVIYGHS